jgi:hypothetical protein
MINNQELLIKAKQYLIAHPPRQLSEATHAQYEKEFLNIIKNCESIQSAIQKICDTRKKATFFKRKYAVMTLLSEQIQTRISGIETADDTEQQLEMLDTLLSFGAQIEAMGVACPIKNKVARKSKRQDLRGLPCNWREQLLERMSDSTNYIPALVLAVSGCRPAELKKGIQIVISDNRMVIKISGAKLGKHKGQPERTLEYHLPTANSLVSKLEEAIKQYSGSVKISIDNTNSFCSAIIYYGRQTFPGRRKAITPYCLRHSFASDLKRNLGDTDDVSRALGHQVDRTKSSYGQAQMGTPGGLAPETISATHNVRHTRTSIKCPDAAIEGLSDSEYT